MRDIGTVEPAVVWLAGASVGRANLWRRGADYNRSGTVGVQDLMYLANRWLKPIDPNQP